MHRGRAEGGETGLSDLEMFIDGSDFVRNAVATQGEFATRMANVKAMRAVKKEVSHQHAAPGRWP